MKILVSACLLGVPCRYDGASVPCEAVCALRERHQLIPVCPEQLGGLSTPRSPAELRDGRVVTSAGEDVTAKYRRGAEETLRLARFLGCDAAILKERSPSCGMGKVYDGSFSGTLVDGSGITAGLLESAGIRVVGESIVERLFDESRLEGPGIEPNGR